ncbi:SNARE Qc [Acrasis kona]|uniref:SNARE Qc n=1 Tax=Acrasis kona TaxID=1008807 RepID=A0AAW2ZPD5_9EUKA
MSKRSGNKKAQMSDAEDWLLIFNESRETLQKIREAVILRNHKLNSGGEDVFKLNANIRQSFKNLDRDLQDLKETLPGLNYAVSDREIARRRSELDNVKQELQELNNQFKKPSNASQGRSELLGKQGDYVNDEEPEVMRGADDQQVLVYQQKVMQQQDRNLDLLGESLERTKHVGIAIGDILDEQSKLLENLDTDVQRTNRNIQKQNSRIVKLLKSSKAPWILLLIIVLFIILIALIVVIVKFVAFK